MDLSNYAADRQKQILSASQMQALNILTMTNQELEDFLVNEYLENPLLENVDQKENEIMTSMDKFSDEGTFYAEQNPGNPEDEDHGSRELSARGGNLVKESLLGQLNWKDYSKTQLKIMGYLVDCLDEKGFFTYDTGELAATSGYPKDEIDQCLTALRELEPAGIFSSNLSECLIRQLKAKDMFDETLFRLLREHLTDLIGGQIGTISRHLGIPTVQVKEYIHLIGSLNPRPLMDIQPEKASYVLPDILISRSGGRWNVELNDQWMGEYKLSDYYLHMMKESTDPELTSYFEERLTRAKLVVTCVEQRKDTIIHITEAILKRQEDYFQLKGPLSPMVPEDIAADLSLHASTVSQAITGKYVQYKKTESLESLFTSAVPKDTEGE